MQLLIWFFDGGFKIQDDGRGGWREFFYIEMDLFGYNAADNPEDLRAYMNDQLDIWFPNAENKQQIIDEIIVQSKPVFGTFPSPKEPDYDE